jgi:DNA-binding transcriptional LysR family regulator
MNLIDVHLFLIITETNSLTQAARRLDISPMAVSRRLASLEQELGTRLMQRTTRSVSLTQEGTEFLPYARALIETEEGREGVVFTGFEGSLWVAESDCAIGFWPAQYLASCTGTAQRKPGPAY